MDKLFICLANSYKRGGRYIAGIEVRFDATGHWGIVRDERGNPRWLRPVSKLLYGEIPKEEALDFNLLTIIRVVDVAPCPICAHSENVYYSRLESTHLQVKLSPVVLDRLINRCHNDIFYGKGKAIHPTDYAHGDYSLMFIQPENATTYVDTDRETPQFRMEFDYHDVHYDFPITDPVFIDFLRDDPEQLGDLPHVFLTLSLGLEYEGWHQKLVAGVLGYTKRAIPAPILYRSPSFMEREGTKQKEEPSYIERQKQLYANAYAKWTEADDALLLELYAKGTPIQDLMKQFGRNKGSIHSRLKKLAEDRLLRTLPLPNDHNNTPYCDEPNEEAGMQLHEEETPYSTRREVKSRSWTDFFHLFSK